MNINKHTFINKEFWLNNSICEFSFQLLYLFNFVIAAEINHFNHELTSDYKVTVQRFLYEQVQMYNKVIIL